MALFDVLGQRWTLRILWELHRNAPLTFRGLQEHCGGLSSSVLIRRLDVLREVRLVVTDDAGYRLSELGEELVEKLGPLLRWSEQWAATVDDQVGP
jgi:DNA-binding HxlR family transcriptional regulator